MILVDTCVLLDVSSGASAWEGWSLDQLAKWRLRGPLLVNPIIFAEWCGSFDSFTAAQQAIDTFDLKWAELPRQALYMASQAHISYRRRGGARAMVLPDFLIGAHAAVSGLPLLTRDRRRFETYFVGLEIVSPSAN